MICLLVFVGALAVPSSDRVAVFAAPWQSNVETLRIIASSNGRLVATGKSEWVAVAESTDSDFAMRLYRAGAIFVVNADFAAACLPSGSFKEINT